MSQEKIEIEIYEDTVNVKDVNGNGDIQLSFEDFLAIFNNTKIVTPILPFGTLFLSKSAPNEGYTFLVLASPSQKYKCAARARFTYINFEIVAPNTLFGFVLAPVKNEEGFCSYLKKTVPLIYNDFETPKEIFSKRNIQCLPFPNQKPSYSSGICWGSRGTANYTMSESNFEKDYSLLEAMPRLFYSSYFNTDLFPSISVDFLSFKKFYEERNPESSFEKDFSDFMYNKASLPTEKLIADYDSMDEEDIEGDKRFLRELCTADDFFSTNPIPSSSKGLIRYFCFLEFYSKKYNAFPYDFVKNESKLYHSFQESATSPISMLEHMSN